MLYTFFRKNIANRYPIKQLILCHSDIKLKLIDSNYIENAKFQTNRYNENIWKKIIFGILRNNFNHPTTFNFLSQTPNTVLLNVESVKMCIQAVFNNNVGLTYQVSKYFHSS